MECEEIITDKNGALNEQKHENMEMEKVQSQTLSDDGPKMNLESEDSASEHEIDFKGMLKACLAADGVDNDEEITKLAMTEYKRAKKECDDWSELLERVIDTALESGSFKTAVAEIKQVIGKEIVGEESSALKAKKCGKWRQSAIKKAKASLKKARLAWKHGGKKGDVPTLRF